MIYFKSSLSQWLERRAASAWTSVKGKAGIAVMKASAMLDLHTQPASSEEIILVIQKSTNKSRFISTAENRPFFWVRKKCTQHNLSLEHRLKSKHHSRSVACLLVQTSEVTGAASSFFFNVCFIFIFLLTHTTEGSRFCWNDSDSVAPCWWMLHLHHSEKSIFRN